MKLIHSRSAGALDNMSASTSAFILTFAALCGSTGALSRPTNVRLTSSNMDLVLRWDPPEGPDSSLLYTTQLCDKGPLTSCRVGCVNTSSPQCDFTRLNSITISQYGKYTGRVGATSGAENSDWVESNPISMDLDTVIGPPNVTLFSNGATIEVSLTDPVFTISTLKDVYGSATYNATYWKDGQQEKATSISDIHQNLVVLSDLDVWTKYCVQVQVSTWIPKPSQPSRVVCETTTNREQDPWVAALVAFVVLAVVVSLVVVTVAYWKRISHFLWPKDALPQHLKRIMLAPPDSSMYLAMQSSLPPEEIYHLVSVTAENRTVAEDCPLEAAESNCSQQPDITVEDKER